MWDCWDIARGEVVADVVDAGAAVASSLTHPGLQPTGQLVKASTPPCTTAEEACHTRIYSIHPDPALAKHFPA